MCNERLAFSFPVPVLSSFWPRIAKARNIDSYVHRILVNEDVDDRRRPWRRELPVTDVPDSSATGSGMVS